MPATQPLVLQQDGRRSYRRLFALVVPSLVALDQLTKYLVVTRMRLGESLPVLGRLLSFTSTRNDGGAMGLVPLGGRGLALVAAVFVVVILVWGGRWARRNCWYAWGLAGLLGGALGNLIDRVRLSYVIDFINIHVWPVFNVADIAVCCGAAMILIGALREGDAPAANDPQAGQPES